MTLDLVNDNLACATSGHVQLWRTQAARGAARALQQLAQPRTDVVPKAPREQSARGVRLGWAC